MKKLTKIINEALADGSPEPSIEQTAKKWTDKAGPLLRNMVKNLHNSEASPLYPEDKKKFIEILVAELGYELMHYLEDAIESPDANVEIHLPDQI